MPASPSNIVTKNDNTEHSQETKIAESDPVPLYQDSGYNRNKTLIAQYVNRILKDFPTPSERYYDIRLVSGEGRRSYFGEVGDQCIMFHSNKVCLITLAPSHPVIKEDKKIVKIEFTFEGNEKIDRQNNRLQGKNKKGGQKLQKNSPLCAIFCSDESKYIATACINSRLMEINQALSCNFDLIKNKPLSSGFIAIVQPNEWRRMPEIKGNLPKLGQDTTNLETTESRVL